MNLDAVNILQMISLAVTGWVLVAVIQLKTDVAAIRQKLKDLPCEDCPLPKPKPKPKLKLCVT
jgi:hypothetical protein